MIKKRAQGLSMNVIIIAAISLIVMIVLIAIFTGRINLFEKKATAGTEEAESRICSGEGRSCFYGETECPEGTTLVPEPLGGWTGCSGVCCSQGE